MSQFPNYYEVKAEILERVIAELEESEVLPDAQGLLHAGRRRFAHDGSCAFTGLERTERHEAAARKHKEAATKTNPH
jgi:hypothetical protein